MEWTSSLARRPNAGHSLQRLGGWLRLERLHRRYDRLGLLFRLRLIQRIDVAHARLCQLVITQPQAFPHSLFCQPFLKRLHAGIYAWADGFPVRA